jgi:hypothetical protein
MTGFPFNDNLAGKYGQSWCISGVIKAPCAGGNIASFNLAIAATSTL